jgi:uncharacterized membrane protein
MDYNALQSYIQFLNLSVIFGDIAHFLEIGMLIAIGIKVFLRKDK